jgi:hypothetical protein
MADGKDERGKKHRLEIPFRIGQRLRVAPFLLVLMGFLLQGILFLAERDIIEVALLRPERRPFVWALVIVGAVLYVLAIFISRVSIVQARPDHLRVRAGIVPLAISYSRINSLRPVQVAGQYPPKSLKGRDRALLEPFFGTTAVSVDLKSFPLDEALLRRLWHKFMFTKDMKGVMLVVEDALGLMQEIDHQRQRYFERKTAEEKPRDLFERVAREHTKQ